jgi:uncharacterized protein YukE
VVRQPGEVTAYPTEVVAQGRDARTLAEQLTDVRSRWASVTDSSADACGYAETAGAYRRMQDAWFGELGVYIRVLEELAAGIETAGRGYQESDSAAGASLAKSVPPDPDGRPVPPAPSGSSDPAGRRVS